MRAGLGVDVSKPRSFSATSAASSGRLPVILVILDALWRGKRGLKDNRRRKQHGGRAAPMSGGPGGRPPQEQWSPSVGGFRAVVTWASRTPGPAEPLGGFPPSRLRGCQLWGSSPK